MKIDDKDKLFKDWYKENERRHHCGHFDTNQIARSGFYAGLEYATIKAEEMLMKDKAWSLIDIIQKLSEAGKILLHNKDYDATGHEEIEICIKESDKWLTQYNQ